MHNNETDPIAVLNRMVKVQQLHSSLIAGSLMLALGVDERQLPEVMRHLDQQAVAQSPEAVLDQVKLAILADANGMPPQSKPEAA